MNGERKVIEKLWENAGHGTRREDIEAAWNAAVAHCAELCIERGTYDDGDGNVFAYETTPEAMECARRIMDSVVRRV